MSGIAATLGLDPASNYSVLSLPLYYVLCIVPHAVAIHIGSRGKPATGWDNRNPRTDELRASLKQRVDAASYARYQRAEAAHYNSLESFPLFAAAVILGNIARVPSSDLNNFVVATALTRAAYIFAYINTSSQSLSFIRSIIWFVQLGSNLRFLWTAGRVLQ